jgi:hypothetical protein
MSFGLREKIKMLTSGAFAPMDISTRLLVGAGCRQKGIV